MEELRQIICEKRVYSRDLDTHDHSYGQLLFPLQGAMQIETNQQTLNLKEDHALFLPPHCSHTFRAIERNEFLILDIPKHYLSSQETVQDSLYIDMDRYWESIRFLLLEEVRDNVEPSNSTLSHLGKYIAERLQGQPYRSVQYIHENYREPISIEKLATIEHYHPAYYAAWFKKVTGKSPSTYIQNIRLEEAKRLLKETSWSISSIAQEVGFEYPSSFTRWFVQWQGVTPQSYRKTFISANN